MSTLYFQKCPLGDGVGEADLSVGPELRNNY
jgi:hypothetical protein